MKKDLKIQSKTGGLLSVIENSPKEYGDYLQWSVGSGYALAVVNNSPQLRRFLQLALNRLEKDARRKGARDGR